MKVNVHLESVGIILVIDHLFSFCKSNSSPITLLQAAEQCAKKLKQTKN